MRKTLSMLLCCISLASLAQVPCRWIVESAHAAPAQFSCYRGETLSIEPLIKEYGVTLTNYTSALYYQTNGMGRAWWQGTNGMLFTPAMDIGASTYSLYVQATKSNGISYRANAVIRMLGSPGETPNTIPLPVQWLDFATTAFTNAPWLLSSEANTSAWNAAAAWGNHAAAGYLSTSTWLSWLGTNTYVKVEADPTVPDHVKGITSGQINAWDSGTNRSDRTYTLYGNTNSWQTVENGTATVWRIEDGADISVATLTVTEDLTIDGGGVILPVGVYTSIVSSATEFIWSYNGTAFGYYVGNPNIGLDTYLVFEDDTSAWYGHNGNTGAFVFPDVMTNLFGTATGGRVTIDYGRGIVTNAYPIATAAFVESSKELHVDSYTNVIWRSVYSNGWMWLVAYTNYPAN